MMPMMPESLSVAMKPADLRETLCVANKLQTDLERHGGVCQTRTINQEIVGAVALAHVAESRISPTVTD